MQDVDYQDWVKEGSGVFGNGERSTVYGVGKASGIKNNALARTTADDSARKEAKKVLSYAMTKASAAIGLDKSQVAEALQSAVVSMQIVDHWIHPVDGTWYALAQVPVEDALGAFAKTAAGAGLSHEVAHGSILEALQNFDASSSSGLALFDSPEGSAGGRKKDESGAEPEPVAAAKPAPKSAPKPTPKPEPKVAARAPILAVFDIETKNLELKKDSLDGLADYMAMRLTESKQFQVVPRSQLKQRLLASKTKTYDECYDQSCQIALGRELAAEKTLATQINKFGSRCTVSLGLYDLKKATAESASTATGGCKDDELFTSVDEAIKKLTAR